MQILLPIIVIFKIVLKSRKKNEKLCFFLNFSGKNYKKLKHCFFAGRNCTFQNLAEIFAFFCQNFRFFIHCFLKLGQKAKHLRI